MRIASLAPSNTEILFALGCGKDIVACTRYCDYPNEANNLPKIGGWLDINDALVQEHKPDVVMTSTFVQDKIVSRYKEKGIALFHTDPKTLDQVYESILAIGKLVNKPSEAMDLIHSMKADFEKIKNNNKRNNMLKVYCEEWHKPPTVSGNWVPKIIEIAGGVSLCPESKISYGVSFEEVSRFDPDCIVISICGIGLNAKLELITTRKEWQSLRAIKQGNIFVIDDSLLNRPGPRLLEGARAINKLIHSLKKPTDF